MPGPVVRVTVPPIGKGTAMNNDDIPVCSQHGRKGIAYDWQSLYAAHQAAGLDHELASLAPEYAE